MKQQWEQCDAPAGWRNFKGPYRAWKHRVNGAILIECPDILRLWRDTGEWRIIVGQSVLRETYYWFGRGRKSPPTTWANKILKAHETAVA